jgi:hypothetical protein
LSEDGSYVQKSGKRKLVKRPLQCNAIKRWYLIRELLLNRKWMNCYCSLRFGTLHDLLKIEMWMMMDQNDPSYMTWEPGNSMIAFINMKNLL